MKKILASQHHSDETEMNIINSRIVQEKEYLAQRLVDVLGHYVYLCDNGLLSEDQECDERRKNFNHRINFILKNKNFELDINNIIKQADLLHNELRDILSYLINHTQSNSKQDKYMQLKLMISSHQPTQTITKIVSGIIKFGNITDKIKIYLHKIAEVYNIYYYLLLAKHSLEEVEKYKRKGSLNV